MKRWEWPARAGAEGAVAVSTETLVTCATAAVVGFAWGRSAERRALRAQIAQGRVASVDDIRIPLTDTQRDYVEAVLDAGGDVLQARIGSTIELLARAGGDRFQRLFDLDVLTESAAPALPSP
ncbi:MAG: hypothetical protein ACI81R_002335 [Bradymonadia bacterium]|jgi:hypothetical protein